jgi:hypothetical protein
MTTPPPLSGPPPLSEPPPIVEPAAPAAGGRPALLLPLAAAAIVLVVGLGVVVALARRHAAAAPRPVPAAVAEAQVQASILTNVPAGYDVLPPTPPASGPLDLSGAAALEATPAAAAQTLGRDGFEGGYIRTWTHQSSPGTIVAAGYQFSSSGGAHSYYDTYVRAQRNRSGTVEFQVAGLPSANGFTDSSDASVVLQTVVFWRGARIYVVGIGDPTGSATTEQAIGLARAQAAAVRT